MTRLHALPVAIAPGCRHPGTGMQAFAPIPLGTPIPDSPHAVSCSLPTMAAVRGYEEKDPAVTSRLQTGYPRFVVHPFARRLAAVLAERHGLGTADALAGLVPPDGGAAPRPPPGVRPGRHGARRPSPARGSSACPIPSRRSSRSSPSSTSRTSAASCRRARPRTASRPWAPGRCPAEEETFAGDAAGRGRPDPEADVRGHRGRRTSSSRTAG